jgi:hypothetical protein
MFPAAIGAIVLAGSAMVGLAWSDHRDQASSVPPVANKDHWHAAYGIYVCGEWQPAIPTYENPDGIHTHGDGVIHIHPFSAAAAGENARLGKFLDSAGVTLTDSELKIGDKTWKEGDDKCDGKEAELVVARWENVQTTDKEPALLHSDFGDTRFREDGEGFTIAFVPTDEANGKGDTDIPKPESASQLAELGSADASNPSGASTTAPEGSTTTAAGGSTTTAPGGATTTAPEGDTTTTAPASGDG